MRADIPTGPAKIFRSDRWKNDHSKKFISKTAPKLCEIKESCGTCRYINDSYEQSLKTKYELALAQFQQAGLLEGTHIMPPTPSPKTTGYRAHAKLAVRPAAKAGLAPKGDGKRFAIGLFQPESHDLVHIENCPLHRESINLLIPDLLEELEKSSLMPYDEELHSGDLRYIAVRASHLTDEVMLSFVTLNEAVKVELKALVLRLRQKEHSIVAAFLNINPDQTNAIFGGTTKKLVGADGLRESLCGLSFEIGPTSFFQVNPWQAALIYRRVEQLAGLEAHGSVAWDLYCGTGQISMLLAGQGFRTLGLEENPAAIVDAEANLVRNRIGASVAPSYLAGRVEDLIEGVPDWARRPQLIVANPSRRGLAPKARQAILDGLARTPNARFVYVSCEAETLVRDLAECVQAGKKLQQLECFDMFPFTEKLEWIAVLQ